MIDRWNAVVGHDDEIWHLGDVCLNPKDCQDYLSLLNGKKYLILGNHDATMVPMVEAGFIKAYQDWKMRIGTRSVYLRHRPKDLKGYEQGHWMLHGHLHDKGPKVDHEAKRINLSVEHWNYAPVPEAEILKILTSR